jgi:hypothetical protein
VAISLKISVIVHSGIRHSGRLLNGGCLCHNDRGAIHGCD